MDWWDGVDQGDLDAAASIPDEEINVLWKDWSLLGRALLFRNIDMVELLLEKGADPNLVFLNEKRKGKGFRPLEYATYFDFGDAISLMLQSGATSDFTFVNLGKTYTCVEYAKERGKSAALEALSVLGEKSAPKLPQLPPSNNNNNNNNNMTSATTPAAAATAAAPTAAPRPVAAPRQQSQMSPSQQQSSSQKSQSNAVGEGGGANAQKSQVMRSQLAQKSQTLGAAPSAPSRNSARLSKVLDASKANSLINYAELTMEGEIGQGAFGKVYKARWKDRNVACKVMSMVKEEKEQEQLRREIQLHHSARHPNIVEMIGVSRDPEKNLVLVLELMEGGDLLTLLKKPTVTLDWLTRVRMARDLSSAVAFLHARNVVHRDLKSENILVSIQNDDPSAGVTVKLCDFGFARSVEQRGRAATVCGTPYYNAPEVLLGKPYDSKADVFAYGVLVIEIITRRAVNIDRIGPREPQASGIDVPGLMRKVPKNIQYPPPFMKLALVCVEYVPDKRPNMKQVEAMAVAIEKSLVQPK